MIELSMTAAETNPPGLWFIVWWMQDAAVWAAILSFAIGLTGAVVGGSFSSRAAKKARAHQIADLKRATADADSRDLHAKFVGLMSAIDQNPEDIGQMIGVVSWYPAWKTIWTPQLRTDLRVGADMIPNKAIRAELKAVIGYLNNARDLSSDGIWPGRPDRSLRYMVGMLAAEGVDIMSSYRRGDEHETKREEFLKNLATNTEEYAKWEAHSEAASERAAETWWQGLTEEEKQAAKTNQEEVVAALHAGAQKRVEKAKQEAAASADKGKAAGEGAEGQGASE